LANRVIALPFFNRIREEQIDEVCSVLQQIIHRARDFGVAIPKAVES
jgi:hypothetical protein